MLNHTKNKSHECENDRQVSYAGNMLLEAYCLTCYHEVMAAILVDIERFSSETFGNDMGIIQTSLSLYFQASNPMSLLICEGAN